MAIRRRETRYPETISACVSEQLKARLDALADQDQVSLGIVIRRCLEAGIGPIERGGDPVRQLLMAEARAWWAGLDNEQRDMWQNRLPGLKGRELIAEAWKAETWHQTQGR